MSYRIMFGYVENKCKSVAKLYRFPEAEWYRTSGGGNKSVVGFMGVSSESGITMVYRVSNESGGVSRLFGGTNAEAVAFLDGMVKGWELTHG